MPLSQSKLLVRVDAGIRMGTGRVRGIHALAREFRQRGGQATIVCSEIPNALRRRIEHDYISVQQTGSPAGTVADNFATQEIIALERPDWLAIDGAAFDVHYVNQIADNIKRISILDGIPRGRANLVIDDAANKNSSRLGDSIERLSGPAFSLVDRLRTQQPLHRKTVAEAKRILVWLHGSDVDNWTLRTLQSLSDLATKRMTVDCMVGQNYKHFAELENFKRYSNVTLRIHKNIDRIEPLAERADLAITSGHTGCYSLAYYGIPMILISTPESNQKIIHVLHQNRAGLSLAHQNESDTSSPPTVLETIKKLLSDQFKRHSLSRHAMDLVDGHGVKRIVNSMASCSVLLRRANDRDCETIWNWRNDPEVRSVALNQEPLAWTTLTDWFYHAQGDPQQQVWIIENAVGQPIGEICFKIDDRNDLASINMLLDQTNRSRGTGALLVKLALEQLFATTDVTQVVAQMRSGNIASEKSFRAAGFEPIAPTVVNGVMASQFLFKRKQSQTSQLNKVA